jgi:cobyrinic acid a,c-diamide synthase
MLASYACNVEGADIHVLEGGSIDWVTQAPEFLNSINVPIILVIDARCDLQDGGERLKHALDALNRYDEIGIIANFVENNEQATLVNDFCKNNESVSLFGLVPQFEEGQFAGRSSLSVNRNSSLLTRNQLVRLRTLVEKHLAADKIITLAKSAKKLKSLNLAKSPQQFVCRIAVADDSAFHLAVQDNWDLLRRAGAELVSFSPLIDKSLPKNVHGVYISGSYFHLYAEEILDNKSLKNSLYSLVTRGLPTYVEGDSVTLFCREIDPGFGASIEGLGIFPVNAFFSNESASWSGAYLGDVFCEHSFARDCFLGSKGATVNSIQSGVQAEERWRYTFVSKQEPLFNEKRKGHPLAEPGNEEAVSNPMSRGLLVADTIVGSSAQLHWGSCPAIAINFVDACVAYRNQQSYAED